MAIPKALCTGAAALLLLTGGAAASAQPQPAKPSAPASINLSKEERAALLPVQNAIAAKDWAAAKAALPAALSTVRSPGARYGVGRFRLEIGVGTNDVALQAQGLEDLIASGLVPAADLPTIYRNQGVLAANAGQKAKAEAAYTKLVELSPNDPDALILLAQVKNDTGKPKEAVQLITRAIELKRSAGQAVQEAWYKYALKLAFDSRTDPAMRAASKSLSRQLVAAFPTKENLRDALLIFRDTNNLDAGLDLDLLRFMRASGTLMGERDWYDLADNLYKSGNYAEAKAVLDDGTAKRLIDPRKAAFAELLRLAGARLVGDRSSLPAEESRAVAAATGAYALRIADAWFGHGEYGKAVALYRRALAKGGVDANLINTRIGMALLASGDRAGADAAFRKLSGPRAELGAFWTTWLSQQR